MFFGNGLIVLSVGLHSSTLFIVLLMNLHLIFYTCHVGRKVDLLDLKDAVLYSVLSGVTATSRVGLEQGQEQGRCPGLTESAVHRVGKLRGRRRQTSSVR